MRNQLLGATIGAGIFLLICYLLGCFNREEDKKILLNDFDKEYFTDLVKENTAVKDAIITDVGYLYIAVINDGEDKTPMSKYYCRLAADKMIGISAVKVVDYSTFKKGEGWAKGKSLGQSFCQ